MTLTERDITGTDLLTELEPNIRAYLGAGCKVVWLEHADEDFKKPLMKKYNDPAVNNWTWSHLVGQYKWARTKGKIITGYGVINGPMSRNRLTLDIDRGDLLPKLAKAVREKAGFDLYSLPRVRSGRTTSAGYHLPMRSDRPFRSSTPATYRTGKKGKDGKDQYKVIVEIIGTGKQAVGHGSKHHSGRRYAIEHGDPVNPPMVPSATVENIISALRTLDEQPPKVEPATILAPHTDGPISHEGRGAFSSPIKAMRSCWRYILKIPNAISDAGGHNRTFHAACLCWKFDLSEAHALEIMARFNSEKCDLKWTAEEIQHKVSDAFKVVSAAGEIGIMLKRQRMSQGVRGATSSGKGKPWHNDLPCWIRNLERPKLRPYQTAILQVIANRCPAVPIDKRGSLGIAFAGFEKLAAESHMCPRSAKKHIKKAVAMRLLFQIVTGGGVNPRTGECTSNGYVVPGVYIPQGDETAENRIIDEWRECARRAPHHHSKDGS